MIKKKKMQTVQILGLHCLHRALSRYFEEDVVFETKT